MPRPLFALFLLLTLPLLAEYPAVLTIDSKVMGEQRTLLVYVPESYARGARAYPVLYMTDGGAHGPHTAATVDFLSMNRRMPEMIVVGINNTDRTRDLTPTRVVDQMFDGQNYNFPTSGGADKFLTFIETEVIPLVEKKYRTEPYRVFAGHSFGGLFALNALVTKPKLFQAWIAVSPSLNWDGGYIQRRLQEFVKSTPRLDTTLVVTLGDEEEIRQPSEDLKKLLTKRGPKGFDFALYEFRDEDHGSVVMPSHYAALKRIFESWRLAVPRNTEIRQLYPLAVDHFARLSKRVGYTVAVPEHITNLIGYRLLGAGLVDQAIDVFRKNVAAYPQSANVYDSLGEALEKDGRLEEAGTNYQRAWEIAKSTKDPVAATFQKNFERVQRR